MKQKGCSAIYYYLKVHAASIVRAMLIESERNP